MAKIRVTGQGASVASHPPDRPGPHGGGGGTGAPKQVPGDQALTGTSGYPPEGNAAGSEA